MTEPLRLSTMMGTYKKTTPLKGGELRSPLLTLDFADVETAQKAFKRVVRKQEFDLAELAIITFLQAFDHGKPFVLLPFVMNGNFHHKSLLCRDDASFTARDLAGRKVAMRSYPQTTPTWVRGILSDEYGVDLRAVQWLSQEEAHVEEARDPPWVTRLNASLGLEELLIAGEVDAIISGGALSGDPRVRTLIPNPAEAARDWNRRTGAIPINHMVVIRREIAEQRPDIVREVERLLLEARRVSGDLPAEGAVDLQPTGFERTRQALEMAIRYAHDQGLIGRRFAVEELYGSVAKALS
jgi:4,5-dihydroxyphthalate decarboxylase